jgi:hypothetical protein
MLDYPLFRIFVCGLAFVGGCVMGLLLLALLATTGPLLNRDWLAIPACGVVATFTAWAVLK